MGGLQYINNDINSAMYIRKAARLTERVTSFCFHASTCILITLLLLSVRHKSKTQEGRAKPQAVKMQNRMS